MPNSNLVLQAHTYGFSTGTNFNACRRVGKPAIGFREAVREVVKFHINDF